MSNETPESTEQLAGVVPEVFDPVQPIKVHNDFDPETDSYHRHAKIPPRPEGSEPMTEEEFRLERLVCALADLALINKDW